MNYKNILQEYCQKQRKIFPSYRIKQQIGPPHRPHFQVEVVVNGNVYLGELCQTKKDAEQSAAKRAYAELTVRASTEQTPDLLHLPTEHADIEQFFSQLVSLYGGFIRKIRYDRDSECYRLDIK
ncbi:unnamed protein product, partial [Didymodactylos carnosus]